MSRVRGRSEVGTRSGGPDLLEEPGLGNSRLDRLGTCRGFALDERRRMAARRGREPLRSDVAPHLRIGGQGGGQRNRGSEPKRSSEGPFLRKARPSESNAAQPREGS